MPVASMVRSISRLCPRPSHPGLAASAAIDEKHLSEPLLEDVELFLSRTLAEFNFVTAAIVSDIRMSRECLSPVVLADISINGIERVIVWGAGSKTIPTALVYQIPHRR